MEIVQNIKCVIVGTKSVGKTSLLNSYVTSPNSSIAPFETHNGIKVEIGEDDVIFQLELWDTNSADYSRDIRKSYYAKSSVILVCYSVMDHDSFKDVRKKVRASNFLPLLVLELFNFLVDTGGEKMLSIHSLHSCWNKK